MLAAVLGLIDEGGKEKRFKSETRIWSCPSRRRIVQVTEMRPAGRVGMLILGQR